MSMFTVPVVRIAAIEPIPGADAIELAVVGDYRSVVRKGQYAAGDLAVYLPEQAVLPVDLIERLGLTGKLAGSAKNRIKAIRLRGCLSQGILYDPVEGLAEGDDAAEALGIVKWDPTVPGHMGGGLVLGDGLALHVGVPIKFDIENYKAHPNLIADGELVEMTEKIHGTFCGVTICPGLDDPSLPAGDVLVYSKGQGGKGMVFQATEKNLASNIYLKTILAGSIDERLKAYFPGQHVHVLGEIYGRGVQDLGYGTEPRFRAFEVYFGQAGSGRYLDRMEVEIALAEAAIDRVPVLYRGPFSRAILYEHTDGRTIAGGGEHIREGCVVTPLIERRDQRHGRVILKSVSGDYLTRKGETTEFA